MKIRWMILALLGSATLLGAQQRPRPTRQAPPSPATPPATPRAERAPRADQARPSRPERAPRPPAEPAEAIIADMLFPMGDMLPPLEPPMALMPSPADAPMPMAALLADMALPTPMPPEPPLPAEPALAPEAPLLPLLQGTPRPWPEPAHVEFEFPHFDFEAPHVEAPHVEFPGPAAWSFRGDEFAARPRPSWAPQDVGDSLWRAARNVFNRGDWGQSVQLFREISQRYPNSTYSADALYYQAYALYRIGRTEDLRAALSALDTRAQRYPNVRSQRSDAPALAMRIRGVLAARGDQAAAAELQRQAAQGAPTCDREEQAVQAEAMNALSRTDRENVNQLIQRVLARKDECAVPLRRTAVFLAGNGGDANAASVLAGVARNDPSLDVRVEAINWLGRLPSEEGLPILEELLRSDTEERIQRAAVRALVQHSSARARTAVRALIDRTDVSDRLRSEALGAFTPERATTEDVTWLRGFYSRTDNPQLKQRALSAITRIGGDDVDQWLMTLVRNENEPSEIRGTAMRRIGKTLSIADLSKLYDDASQQRLRMEIISILASRSEDAAADKLIDIAKNGTDPNLRTRAVNALSSKAGSDPRAKALLMELINK